jgi:hypothetical protein
MGLSVPVVGSALDAGPAYATEINESLTTIDGHTHQPGSGVPITQNAINFGVAPGPLPFYNNPATGLSGVSLQLQTSLPTTIGTLYSKLGSEGVALPDLWYYDGTNYVQITSGGQVAATIANIPGESYASGTFTWRQGTGSTTPANFDIGSIVIRPNTAGATNGVSLQNNASIASQYPFIFPAALPSAQSFSTLDNSGNLAAGILTAKGLTAANIANHTITPLIVAPNYVVSSSSGTFSTTNGFGAPAAVTNLSCTITTNGNPVELRLIDDGNLSVNSNLFASAAGFSSNAILSFYNGGTELTQMSFGPSGTGVSVAIPVSSLAHTDFSVAGSPGSYTYTVYAQNTGSGGTTGVSHAKLVAKEMM